MAELQRYRATTVDDLDSPVKTTPGSLYSYNIINKHTADIFVKFYNKDANAINPVSDTPVLTLQVPANGSVVELRPYIPNYKILFFDTAISVRAVTGSSDTDNTAPSTLPIVELYYD
jgi:hypothetical protein